MPPEKPNADESKGSKSKTMIIVGSILVLEAAVIIGIMMMLTGPARVDASSMPETSDVAGDDRIVEVLVLDARLPNSRSGISYLYETEIFVQTRQRHVARVQRELDQFQNEIRAELTAIWRTSDPHHFQEPRLENLTRKVEALFHERFGTDRETGEPIIRRCVIVMGTGFRVDS